MQAHPLSSPAARKSPASTSSLYLPEPPTPSSTSLPSPPPLAGGAALAHDAGNLLGALRLYSDLLQLPGVLKPEHRHYASELCLISERSSSLIQRLIDAAPSLGSPPSFQEPHGRSLLATLRALRPLLGRIAGPAVSVRVELPTQLPPLQLSAEAVERIVVNLVRNAANALASRGESGKAGPGHIHVRFALRPNDFRLEVTDNGPGITMRDAAAFLSPTPQPPEARHGFGHRIIHELAHATGGSLAIRVRPGHGSTFTLRWPLERLTPRLTPRRTGTLAAQDPSPCSNPAGSHAQKGNN